MNKEVRKLKDRQHLLISEVMQVREQIEDLRGEQNMRVTPRYVMTNVQKEGSTTSSPYVKVTIRDAVELLLAKFGLDLEVAPEKVILKDREGKEAK